MAEKILYRNGSVMVTESRLTTRYKDEDIDLIRHVRVGREPLLIAAASGIGIAAFAVQFGDLLYLHEQVALVVLAALMLFGGWSVASLKIGAFAFEKTVLWGSFATIRRVREAINEARAAKGGAAPVVLAPVSEG